MDGRQPETIRDLSRMFRPRSIVVFGGWWAENVIAQCRKSGFDGDIWPVHPTRTSISDVPCFDSLAALPGVPDAAFLGINRHAVIDIARDLADMGCGGGVCFASGFAETGDDDLQAALVEAAGNMPLLGPNCYGFLNYLDGAMLWPDQHGGQPVDSGVAIISQSSNIAINISMQARGLPVAYIACVGNQAQTTLSDMARTLLADERVTAAGIYVEGFIDPADFAAMASEAAARGKSIVAIKSGKTEASAQAASSHTAALAGSAAASAAFLAQCGVIEANGPEDMLETLKILHCHGRVDGARLSAMCCSGGEAGLIADLAATPGIGDTGAMGRALSWPDIPASHATDLSAVLGPLVTIANPLDYHTFIWGDEDKMMQTFAAMMGDWVDMSVLVIDFPRADRCSDAAWMPAVAAMRRAGEMTGTRTAMLGTLAEGISDAWAGQLMDQGIVPLCGFEHGLRAISLAARPVPNAGWTPMPAHPAPLHRQLVDEADAKTMLSAAGIAVPAGRKARDSSDLATAAAGLQTPLVLKGLGHAHKSEAGLVRLSLMPDELADAAASMTAASGFLVEEMASPPVAELLLGVQRDPVYGATLTIGAGGTAAELLRDVVTLVLPVDAGQIRAAIDRLTLAPLLHGYRGRPASDIDAAVDVAVRLTGMLDEIPDSGPAIDEIEINPLMLGQAGAIAVDAVIWMRDTARDEPARDQPGQDKAGP